MHGQEEKRIVWGFKSDPLTFWLSPTPLPPFFPFHFGGNIFFKQTSSDNGISLKEVQMGGGTRFSWKFSSQLFMFFHIFLWPIGVLFKGSPLPPPPPPCTSCHSATLPMNIKTFYLTTDTRCGWVRITVLPNFFVACEGRGVWIKANVFAIIFFPANRPFSRWQHLTTTTRIHFILALLFKFFNPAGLLKQ